MFGTKSSGQHSRGSIDFARKAWQSNPLIVGRDQLDYKKGLKGKSI